VKNFIQKTPSSRIINAGTVPTTAGNAGSWIAANVAGETFTCTPGELFSFRSTSTSGGSFRCPATPSFALATLP